MIRKRDGKMFAAACFAFGLIGPAAAQDMSEFDRFFCDRRDCVGQSRPGKVSVAVRPRRAMTASSHERCASRSRAVRSVRV